MDCRKHFGTLHAWDKNKVANTKRFDSIPYLYCFWHLDFLQNDKSGKLCLLTQFYCLDKLSTWILNDPLYIFIIPHNLNLSVILWSYESLGHMATELPLRTLVVMSDICLTFKYFPSTKRLYCCSVLDETLGDARQAETLTPLLCKNNIVFNVYLYVFILYNFRRICEGKK